MRSISGAATRSPYLITGPIQTRAAAKASVAEFFKRVSESEDFQQFEPCESIAQGDTVVAIGHYRAVTKATGKTFDADFVMVFTLRDGKVATFREFTDSAGINAAFA